MKSVTWREAKADPGRPVMREFWLMERTGKKERRVGVVTRYAGTGLWSLGAQSWHGSCHGMGQSCFSGVPDLAEAQRRVAAAAVLLEREDAKGAADVLNGPGCVTLKPARRGGGVQLRLELEAA